MFTFSGFKKTDFYFTLAWKPNPLSTIIYSVFALSLLRVALSRSCLCWCWHDEYKQGSTPEPLALRVLLFTWSVQWLLLQCAAALQRCMEQTLWSRLRCWAQWDWYFTHFKLQRFQQVQRIVRFVMRTEPKASYRTVQYEYAYRYTSTKYVIEYCRSAMKLIQSLPKDWSST